jgi:hypothetical protein
VLYHLSRSAVTFDDGLTVPWDMLRARHVIVSEAWEADLMSALAARKGSGADGGKGKDHVKVKRRVVIDVPAVAWLVPADGFMLSFPL